MGLSFATLYPPWIQEQDRLHHIYHSWLVLLAVSWYWIKVVVFFLWSMSQMWHVFVCGCFECMNFFSKEKHWCRKNKNKKNNPAVHCARPVLPLFAPHFENRGINIKIRLKKLIFLCKLYSTQSYWPFFLHWTS